jgi:hypothetical protein
MLGGWRGSFVHRTSTSVFIATQPHKNHPTIARERSIKFFTSTAPNAAPTSAPTTTIIIVNTTRQARARAAISNEDELAGKAETVSAATQNESNTAANHAQDAHPSFLSSPSQLPVQSIPASCPAHPACCPAHPNFLSSPSTLPPLALGTAPLPLPTSGWLNTLPVIDHLVHAPFTRTTCTHHTRAPPARATHTCYSHVPPAHRPRRRSKPSSSS